MTTIVPLSKYSIVRVCDGCPRDVMKTCVHLQTDGCQNNIYLFCQALFDVTLSWGSCSMACVSSETNSKHSGREQLEQLANNAQVVGVTFLLSTWSQNRIIK